MYKKFKKRKNRGRREQMESGKKSTIKKNKNGEKMREKGREKKEIRR